MGLTLLTMVNVVVSLQRTIGITPLTPIKQALANSMMMNIATFSRQACFASVLVLIASFLASGDMPFVIFA